MTCTYHYDFLGRFLALHQHGPEVHAALDCGREKEKKRAFLASPIIPRIRLALVSKQRTNFDFFDGRLFACLFSALSTAGPNLKRVAWVDGVLSPARIDIGSGGTKILSTCACATLLNFFFTLTHR